MTMAWGTDAIYVVRLASDHQLVGIFAAGDMDVLSDLIDEAVNVDECEFAAIERLALLWPDTAHPVPLPRTDDAPNYDGMMFSELMDREIESATWRPIPQSTIYFISDGSRVKIGVTVDLLGRLKKLQTGNAATLSVLRTMRGGKEEEENLHERFAHLRLRGEWFRHEGALAALIEEGR